VGLREALLRRSDVIVETITRKLMTYALARGVEAEDMPAVRAIVSAAARQNYRFSSLVLGIVESTPFRMRVKPGSAVDTAAARLTLPEVGR
jgi:hypothetical protein